MTPFRAGGIIRVVTRRTFTSTLAALLCLLRPRPAFGAARTSSQSGPWSASATWGGSAAPGDGDTATISTGHVVTVDVNTTVGTSGVNGTTVVTMAAITSQVVVATGVTFVLRGDFLVRAGATATVAQLLLNAGATLEFDSSAAADPANTKYAVKPHANSFFGYFRADGTAGSRCTVRSNAGGGNGYFSRGGFVFGGDFVASYTDFLRIGDATQIGFSPYFTSSGTGTVWNVQHCSFTSCGGISGSGTGAAAISSIQHKYNLHTGTVASYPLMFTATVAMTSGIRNITGNVFDKIVGYDGAVTASPLDYTIEDNMFYGGVNFGATSLASFARNLWRSAGSSMQGRGSMSSNLVLLDTYTDGGVHVPDIHATVPFGWEYNVIDGTFAAANMADISDGVITTAGATQTISVKYNLLLPVGDGRGACSLVTLRYADFAVTLQIEHNTVASGFCLIELISATDAAGASAGTIKDNNVFGSLLSDAYMLLDVSHGQLASPTPQQDMWPVASIATNNRFQITDTRAGKDFLTNQGNGYIAKWSVTPGTSDLEVDPQFVDSTRNTATFDSAYLLNVASSTWASHAGGDTFSVGDIISDQSASYFANALINYRCIVSHTKNTANSQPGVGSAFHTYWEFASLNSIRTATYAQTTITDAAIGASAATYIVACWLWIRAGYAPRNLALKGAASDGGDIGAISVVVSSGCPGGGAINVPRLKRSRALAPTCL